MGNLHADMIAKASSPDWVWKISVHYQLLWNSVVMYHTWIYNGHKLLFIVANEVKPCFNSKLCEIQGPCLLHH